VTSTRVFLSVTPVGPRRPARADPFTYRETRPVRYRASWWTRGTTTEVYRSKLVDTQAEAVGLARKWLGRENKTGVRWIDTTDHPERFGYALEPSPPTEKKSATQLDREIDEVLAKKEAP